MLIIPAIDIMGGKVVRLEKGDFETAKIYRLSPLEYARQWESQGARFLHIVDLDGARVGKPLNFEVITEVLRNLSSGTKMEVGGGIRNTDVLKQYLELGAERVVLSTKVQEDESFLQQDDVKSNIARISVSVDIKRLEERTQAGEEGKYLSVGTGGDGWLATVELRVAPYIRYLAELGITHINFSDISRDGTLAGPDLAKIRAFLTAARSSGPRKLFFTYAGGISSLKDIGALKSLGDDGVDAVIVGKALYENKFMLKEAMAAGA